MKVSLKLLERTAKRVIVSSDFIRKEVVMATNIREGMIDVVPLAYSDTLFTPMPGERRRDFLDKYHLKGKYLLFVGTLFPYKNLKTLTDAFLRIKNQIPHSLVIVGRKQSSAGPLARDERIVYVDYVPAEDLPLFYSYADMFIYPSLREGFGIPPLEAMACGTPVISSNGGSLPEVVGDAGLLFDPGDSEVLGGLILKVVHDERLRDGLIDKGFRNVKKFSWERTAEGIIRSCERAVEGKG
jgi:glycosyltransferase involved in cell wall biosynthesis